MTGVRTRSAQKMGEFSMKRVGYCQMDPPMRLCVRSYWNCRGTPEPQRMPVVGADHVGHRRARGHRTEAIGLGHHVGDLIAAPTVPLYADGIFLHEALVDY